MYIRTKTTKNSLKKSVQVVESVRQGDKVKQRIVRHIGVAEDEHHLEELKSLLKLPWQKKWHRGRAYSTG